MFLVVRAGCVGFVCVIFRCLFGLIDLWCWCVYLCGFTWILPMWVYVVLLVTCFGVLVLFSIWLFLVRFLACCGGDLYD